VLFSENRNMKRITLDAALASQLHELYQAAELCDPTGKVVGQFEPVFDPSEWEILGPSISDEELEQRAKSDKWYTTEEVLAHIKSLERQ
jgi:hypothetical protein